MNRSKILETSGAMAALAGLGCAAIGGMMHNTGGLDASQDWIADLLAWGGGALVLIGVVASLAGRFGSWSRTK